jgi:hypothetical protein
MSVMNMPWVKMNRDLKKGDVIRSKITNPEHLHYGDYLYAICIGEGFGCSMETFGTAIFVVGQSLSLRETLKKAKKIGRLTVPIHPSFLMSHSDEVTAISTSPWTRWERSDDIEILEGKEHD